MLQFVKKVDWHVTFFRWIEHTPNENNKQFKSFRQSHREVWSQSDKNNDY